MGVTTVKGDRYDNTIGFRLPHLIAEVETSNDGAAEATFDVTAQMHLVVLGAPALSASFDMADYVQKNGGTLPFGFRDSYMDRYSNNGDGEGLWFSGNGPDGGHAYFAVHSLGKSSFTAAQAMRICDDHIGSIFPGGAVEEGAAHTKIDLNRLYRLHIPYGAFLLGGPFDPSVRNGVALVECTDASLLHFTFSTTDQHTLQGTALHGAFKDSAGELWMYQQGRGNARESIWAKWKTYIAAHTLEMWREMAANLRTQLNLKNSG